MQRYRAIYFPSVYSSSSKDPKMPQKLVGAWLWDYCEYKIREHKFRRIFIIILLRFLMFAAGIQMSPSEKRQRYVFLCIFAILWNT